jgi:hypothetical protein
MDWRLIAALASAGGSLCLVAVGAYAVMSANPAQPRKYAPPPSLLSANKAGTSAVGAPLASLTPGPAAPPSPFAPSPLAIPSPAVTPGPAAPSTLARPSAVVTPGPFAPSTLDPPGPALAPSPFAPVANLDLAPSPVGPPVAVGAGPSIDLRRVSDRELHKPPLFSTEARREHQPPHKLAALTPPDAAPRHEPPPRPMVELKRPTMVPEIHTALPTAHYQGVLTNAEIFRIKNNLRLSPDQEPKWPPVEAALSEMGRQQILLIRHGQEPRVSPNDWPPQRLYSVAGPLLMSLRPDQKDQVRRLCRSLGFESVASML